MPTTNSTIVRALPMSLRLARTGLRTLAQVAPGPAAKTASRLFCKPVRHRRPERENEWLKDAEPFRFRLGRKSIQAWRWGDASRPLVLLMHGWSGRGSQLGAFAAPLVESGYSVVTWDGPGHGDSPGSSSSLVEMADACFAAIRHLRTPVHGIIAHSMGSGAAGICIAEGLPFHRAAWIAPPASMLHFVHGFRDVMGFSKSVGDRITNDMNTRFSVDLADYDVEAMAVPHGDRILIAHDKGDREVPIEHGQRVAAAIGAGRFAETSGLGHRRILTDKSVLSETVQWLDQGRPIQ